MIREAREEIPFEKHAEDPKFAPGSLPDADKAKDVASGRDAGMKAAPVPATGPAAADTPLEGVQRGPPPAPVASAPGGPGEDGPPGEGGPEG